MCKRSHIPGAILLPLSELMDRADAGLLESREAGQIFLRLIEEEKSHLKRLGQQLEKTAGE